MVADSMSEGKIAQDDPKLINHIRDYYIGLPSSLSYEMTTTSDDTSMGQAAVVNKVFKGKKNGFFVECGALDGETRSNSYFFERQLNWNGILIEGAPENFKTLLSKHRKVYSLNACLSKKNYPMKVVFKQNFNVGRIAADGKKDAAKDVVVQCLPLYSVLLSLNQTTVDYFSLDIEGDELDVLKTIPFDKINIRVLSVEYIHDKGGKEDLIKFMDSQVYVAYAQINYKNNFANDIIFVKKELTDSL